MLVMHLGKNNPGYTYNMNGKQLETVKGHKDLSVVKISSPFMQCYK